MIKEHVFFKISQLVMKKLKILMLIYLLMGMMMMMML